MTVALRLLVLALSLYLAGAARAEGLQATPLPEGQSLRMSGRMDDPLWQTAPLYDQFWEYQPQDGRPAPQRTTVKVLYDKRALYFGIRAYDTDPALIRAPLVRRDGVLADQDFVAVLLDPIGSGKSAMFVRVNPKGVVADGIYSAVTSNMDLAPDFDVDARAVLLDDGYAVELRIPYSELRFDAHSDRPWQVQVLRSLPREQNILLASAPLKRNFVSQIELMSTLNGLHGFPADGDFTLLPHLTLRHDRNQWADGTVHSSNYLEPGVDIKWHPSAEWVVDGTVKPDFSQVELDVPQLTGNQQFAQQFPEKRPFFLESSDILEAPTMMAEQGGGGWRSLYTRSISQPGWGLRATRRDADSEAIVLALHDRGGGQILVPGPYFTDAVSQPASDVVWARGRTYVGGLGLAGLLTDVNYHERGSNMVGGTDVVWNSQSGDRLRAQWLLSSTSAKPGSTGALQRQSATGGSYVIVDWIRKSDTLEPSATYQEASGGFRNDSGFLGQNGFRQATVQLLQKNAFEGAWTEIDPYLWYQETVAGKDGSTVLRWLDPGLWITGPHNTQITAEYHPAMAQRVKPGGQLHSFDRYYLEVDADPASWFNKLTAKYSWGHQMDVANDRAVPGIYLLMDAHFRALDRMEIQLRLEQTVLRSPTNAIALRDTAEQVVAVYHVSAQDWVRAIWQREQIARRAVLATDVPGGSQSSGSGSLMLSHRLSAHRVGYLGVSYGKTSDSPGVNIRGTELFAKLQFDL